ncbi:unnamed protein product [Rotaria sp. Silwood2]|nr:unnamed protein product [Rotaria sp. Silwood2]CAF4560363.1 unnamed protein product [Rotaria sp. Silwood2]CAF4674782.1 unnamed protein product [Rotaria sp. Silwood2]
MISAKFSTNPPSFIKFEDGRCKSWRKMVDVKAGGSWWNYPVAEIVSDQGHLGKTNVPNVSTIRSIRYSPDNMKVFKASSIGAGIAIPYKKIDFETNMRIVSPFGCSIDKQQSNTISKE